MQPTQGSAGFLRHNKWKNVYNVPFMTVPYIRRIVSLSTFTQYFTCYACASLPLPLWCSFLFSRAFPTSTP